MAWIPLGDRLKQLPLVLAGPLLRRTEAEAVTVWVALQNPCRVTLQVYATQAQGHQLDGVVMCGSRPTIAIGEHLHLVAVTALPISGDRLKADQLYAYDLHFRSLDSKGDEDAAQSGDRPLLNCTLIEALRSTDAAQTSISYFPHQLPTFALPPTNLNHLKIVHGSCRKPHGKGSDALPWLDHLLTQSSHDPTARPHQLFLTGDQIYGDDVADPWLYLLTEVGNTLLGWQEQMPLESGQTVLANQCLPGQRSQQVETEGGFTAGLQHQPQKAKSHLLSFGEYCAAYLLAWSPVLHERNLPDHPPASWQGRSPAWKQEVKAIQQFIQPLWRVRRVLANIPTYTVFDDHDISDDWYLNQAWCLRVLGKPLGRRVVQNGLQAYALFQGWGNTPQVFEVGQVGERLLQAMARWSTAQGSDVEADRTIARILGLPAYDSHTDLPQFRRDGEVFVLDRDRSALDWHYTVRGDRHEVIVLDTRTWRGYPVDQSPQAPPMLLSPTAMQRQLQTPMQLTDRLNSSGAKQVEATFVIAPTNLVHMRAIDWVQQWNLKQGNVYHNDVGDAWNLHKEAFAALLEVLFEWRDRVIVLSGDIHYGYAVRLNYWSRLSTDPTEAPHVLAQLTSSAFKNAEWKTQVVHTKLKSIAPEPPQQWVGWRTSPPLWEIQTVHNRTRCVPLPRQKPPVIKQIQPRWGNEIGWLLAVPQAQSLPDWRYRLEWIKRQPAQTLLDRAVPEGGDVSQCSGWRWLLQALIQGLSLVWRNRWLQEGDEVVGFNNFGIVHLCWAESKSVIQDLYWVAPWKAQPLVFSRFEVPLQLESPPPQPIAVHRVSVPAQRALTQPHALSPNSD